MTDISIVKQNKGKSPLRRVVHLITFIIFSINLTSIAECRGCNKPYRVCTGKGITKMCVWHNRNGCEYCDKKECSSDRGCKWGGLFKKHCRSDFTLGRDAVID